ncbi:RNA polymerase sigma factor [Pseudofulvibacter geojedonensis]|uniref:RNA polymerase sigma factor n=1 Tax=Pseudofulvibacter geojedonensis TaxID=1123758 RepID=A0ABW3I000_9FLAO
MSLEQLIIKCGKQDVQAQGAIYKLYASKLFTLCLKYSKNYPEAEDNLQDAFLTIFKKIKQYKNNGSFEGWMKRIVINTALQRYRKEGVLDVIKDDNIKEEPVEVDTEDVSIDYLLQLIQELPDRYRLVFNLYVLDGYSHKEIAVMLNISVGTSKSNLSRARLILKERIEENQFKNKQTP